MFSVILRKLREDANITRKELSDVIGISTNAIANYENGLRKPDNDEIWIKIANYFHVSVDYLMGVDDVFIAANLSSQKPTVITHGDKISKTQQHRNILAEKIRNSNYTNEQLEKNRKND